MKLFFAHSFSPQDEKVVEQFRNFFKKTLPSFQLIEKDPQYGGVWKEVRKLIRSSEGAIGILTKDAKHPNMDEWCTRGWILSEVAYCMGRGFVVPIFVEKGVSNLGLLREETEYMSFTRNEKGGLNLDKKNAAKYIKSVFNPSGASYHIRSKQEFLYVTKDGHGLSEKIISLYKPPEFKFKGISHHFRLTGAAETQSFPSLPEMQEVSYVERFIKPIFYSRILGDTKKRMKVIEDETKSTKT